MRHLILITFFSLFSSLLNAQEIELTEKEDITIGSLQKGKFMLGIGAYLDEERRKNEEDFTSYILDEKNSNLNIRLSMGYFDQDRKAFGMSFRYIRNNTQTKYLDLSRDTLNYSEKDNEFHIITFRNNNLGGFGDSSRFSI